MCTKSKIISILLTPLIIGLILPNFSFAQSQSIQPPETLEGAKEMGKQFGEEASEKLPGIFEGLWEEEVMPIWRAMWNWAKNFWQETVWPWLAGIFQEKVKPPLEEEIEKRKPFIEEEFQKEKQELQEEAPKVGKSLWERFKELLK